MHILTLLIPHLLKDLLVAGGCVGMTGGRRGMNHGVWPDSLGRAVQVDAHLPARGATGRRPILVVRDAETRHDRLGGACVPTGAPCLGLEVGASGARCVDFTRT